MRWQTTALALLLAGAGCLDHADREPSSAHSGAAALTPAQGTDVSGDQGGVVTYTYDGSGRRVLKEYAPASDGVRAVYSVGEHLDVVEREDGSLVMERYVLIGGRRAVYIPDDADGEIYHLHSDVLGSPRWITNSSGGLVRHLRYEPFGRSLDDNLPLRYRHAGEEVSERLTHLGGVRQYNSAIGRMMQPDSLIPDPANPQSLNRYAYAYNEPLGYVDPSGHWALPWEVLDVVSYKLSADAWVASISRVVDNPTSGSAWMQLGTDTVGVFADAASLLSPVVPATYGLSKHGLHAVTTAATEVTRVDHAVDTAEAGGSAARRAATDGAAGAGAAKAGGKNLFKIDDGVRRSKSAEIVGNDTIPARIKRAGHPDELANLPVDSLRSPKTKIRRDSRFLDNNLAPAQAGSTPPPIEVVPISGEIPGHVPIREVEIVP
jgi:RHS repeat-associated protein